MAEVTLDIALQTETIEYVKKYWDSKAMIKVYGKQDGDDSTEFVTCWIMPEAQVEEELKSYYRSNEGLKPGITIFDDKHIEYKRFNNEKAYEPFVVEQCFHGIKENHIELVEEFRLLFNLYFDEQTKQYKDLDKDCVVASIQENDTVCVNKRYLKIYLAYKKAVLVVFLNKQVWLDDEDIYEKIKSLRKPQISEKDNDFCYSLILSNSKTVATEVKSYFTSLYAKKIIYPARRPISELEKDGMNYQSFIIDVDENGNEIEYTCDPEQLSDYFNKNGDAPEYLTPVFFNPEVLNKYNYDDRYIVEDGIVRYGYYWSLHIDNNHKDYVVVWLGDLGRDLPKEEQCHWRSYNELGDGMISEVAYRREIAAEFTEPSSILLNFRDKYDEVNEESLKILGEYFFKKLKDEDRYNLKSLHIPSDNSTADFDFMIITLTKMLVDSLNVDFLKSRVRIIPEKAGSIKLLELCFSDKKIVDWEKQISFLKKIQDIRSSGAAHRRGTNYTDAKKKFKLVEKNYSEIFKELLKEGYDFLCYLQPNLGNLK